MSIPLSPSPASSPQPFVPLPRLLPAVPPPGRKAIAQPFAGSADALALAQAATDAAQRRQLLAVVCADALAAQRLAAEIAWFAPALKIAVLPDWETLPYDHFSPHQDLVSERLATLYRMSRGDCDVVIVAATTALYRFAPPSYLAAFTFFIEQGETLDVDRLRSQLALAGYQHVTQVVSPGEFGIRGGLIDLFPMGSPLPYRIDLFDNQIESIRTFDVDSQRTVYPVPRVRLLPAREFPQDEAGRTRFRGRFREVFEGDPSKSPLYKDVSNGIMPAGIEYYLPLFFDATATLAEYLPPRGAGLPARRRDVRRSGASGKTPTRATGCCAAIARGRCSRHTSCSCRKTSSIACSSRSPASSSPRSDPRHREDRLLRVRPTPRPNHRSKPVMMPRRRLPRKRASTPKDHAERRPRSRCRRSRSTAGPTIRCARSSAM